MDRVTLIIKHEWRAYWRKFSRAGFRSNQGIVLLFSVLVAFKYFQVLRVAAGNIAHGNTRLLLQLLTAIFLVWVYPVAANRRDTLASRKWMHLPLSVGERFMVRAVSLLIPPSAWLVLFGSLAILFPLAYSPNPATGIFAGLLFIVTAWFTGLTIAHLLNSPSWRKLLWIVAIGILLACGVYVIRGGRAADLLSFQFVPSRLVVDAAMKTGSATFASLGMLLALAIGSGGAAVWSFKSSLASVSETGGQKLFRASAVFPGRLGGLIFKDFSYFRRLLDIYLGVAAALLACVYLLIAIEAAAGVFWSFIVIVFLCNAAVPFNSFGLDNRAGLDRYALLPLSGKSILLSKNVAYLMIVGAQLLPMFVLAGWRLGLLTSAFGLVEAFALACSYLAWGNWMSVNHPLKMQFFRFANSGAALVDAMGGIFFGSLPGVVMIFLVFRGGRGSTAGLVLVLLLTSTLYCASLARFGYRFERQRERLAEALS